DINEYDTVVMFGIDGTQLYQDKQSDCWIYIWIVIDFALDVRYKKMHVLPGGVLLGLHKPKHMDSFLIPGFHHVAAQKILTFVNQYLGCSDTPGSVYISGVLTCWLYCDIKGRCKPGVRHYYPALLRPHHYNTYGCTHPDLSVHNIKGPSEETYQTNLAYVLNSTSGDYECRRKITGIVKPSLISRFRRLHRLPLTLMFAGDFMHIPPLNMGDLFPLWRGMFTCESPDSTANWDWAVLKGKIWEEHGVSVAECRLYLPGSFDQPPQNIALKIKSDYKSKEWQGYLYALVPALLHNVLPHKYWHNSAN
ncbi:hypothetical protein K439DRAFT_1368393, partial [Ramaria rubella]